MFLSGRLSPQIFGYFEKFLRMSRWTCFWRSYLRAVLSARMMTYVQTPFSMGMSPIGYGMTAYAGL